MTMQGSLDHAKRIIEKVVEQLDSTPDVSAVHDLIEACERLDEKYQEFCSEMDEDFGYEEGSTYETGISIEFYIEASDMHDVSIALRKLKEKIK